MSADALELLSGEWLDERGRIRPDACTDAESDQRGGLADLIAEWQRVDALVRSSLSLDGAVAWDCFGTDLRVRLRE